jgi:catechol 2,3-dioxygenase-like lactoylglutathione lyase family enzyme
MTISLSGVHVLVDDPDDALSFYRDTLGLTVRDEVAGDGFRWITLVTDSQPEIEIVLSQPHAGRSLEDGDAIAALLAKGELQMVQLRSDDLDETFDKIAAAPEAEVLQEPITQTRGARDIAVRDPAGNHVRIEQKVEPGRRPARRKLLTFFAARGRRPRVPPCSLD